MTLTIFDYLVFAIMIFFIFLGLIRGFLREFFSLVNWVSSGLLTVILRPYVNNLVSQKISNEIISNIVSSGIVFFVVIIGLSIITANIIRAINTKFPQSINITLGVASGFIKGFLISSLIFVSIISLLGNVEDLSSKSGPKWLQDSQSYRALSFGGYIILPFANSILGQIKEKYGVHEEDKKDFDNIGDLIKKKEDSEKTEEETNKNGYKKDQIEKLNHLINVI